MSRYGWSRPSFSPYTSMSGGPPPVTDEDFSYITSQELEDPNLGVPVDDRHHRSYSGSDEDDVLLIKNKGVTYPAHFPAYTIGDGKLRVKDIRDRVGLMMDLSDRTMRRVKLLYKGRQLKESTAPVREYGVKNKSEIMAVVPDGDDGSSPSEEEMVIVGDSDRPLSKAQRKRKKRSKKKADKGTADDGDTASSPRDSTSNFEPPHSPSSVESESLKKLEDLSHEFRTKWLPVCVKFTASPPEDQKKREEEHRKLSESVLQHILLKTDGVETDGNPDIRARRKALVKEVQEVLKGLDVAKAS